MSFRRLLTRSAYVLIGLGAAVVGIVGTVLLLVVVVGSRTDADPAKARVEVQKFYDERAPGLIEVVDCDYVELDSVFDQFACSIKVKCRKRFMFSVPRAGAWPERFDDPVSTEQRSERPSCRS